jgi:CheY-like chemotaxis protein
MPEGGTLTVAAGEERIGSGHRSRLMPGRYLRLSVTDTGTGMDEATLARAIEPFFSTKGIGKGTGLGLSMVHGLAAQLGGALTLASRPGVGTNAELWLPLALASEPGPAAPDAPAGADAGSGVALVVDDEPLVRASTADMLVEMGYEVIEASSANEALIELAKRRFDLLVTDHLMPGMTGAELANTVRARFPGLPVLIVSGYADVDAIAPDLPRLSKPFRRADLAAALGELVEG